MDVNTSAAVERELRVDVHGWSLLSDKNRAV